MAWTEQCKVAFHANCTAKLGRFKNRNRKLTGVLRELSKESGIPFNTLNRWWYEQTKARSKKSIYTKNDADSCDSPLEMCERCKEKPVFLNHGKPYTKESKYYGLCNPCRMNQLRIEHIDRTANAKNGIMTVCPHCEKVHYIFDESKYNRKRGAK